jgi:putative transposase
MLVSATASLVRRYADHLPMCTKKGVSGLWRLFSFIKQRVSSFQHVLQKAMLLWMKPPLTSLMLGTLADTTRSKAELLAENALLRQQRIMLSREVKRPAFQKTDRLLLVLLVRMVRFWKEALLLVQPETLLRWHRELFRLFTEAQIQRRHEQAKTLA